MWHARSNGTGKNTGKGKGKAATAQSAPRAASAPAQSRPGYRAPITPGSFRFIKRYRRMLNHMHDVAIREMCDAITELDDATQAFSRSPNKHTHSKLVVARICAEDHPPQPPKNNDPPKKK